MRRRRTKGLIAGIFFLLLTAGWFYFATRDLTREMWKDGSYRRWAKGTGPYKEEHYYTFLRDYEFQRRFIGKPITSVESLFPALHRSAGYDPDSYRAQALPYHLRLQRKKVDDYWIHGGENDFGLCILVVDGKIVEFRLVKG